MFADHQKASVSSNQGETFTKSEAAAILSSAVNLYRFQDVHLRRMFHLIARDLCPIADETLNQLEDNPDDGWGRN
ncbi:coatomer subunit gamma-like [Salvia divinorum]|uniref:Coatomer subunit gamma-like n=1 Tax=Salvia divinorum TaxID=28513 RepID=A0ABD1IGV7_SALDI